MANTFEYNAPQFLDFNEGLDYSDGADKFFDVESDTPCRSGTNNKKNLSENGNIKPIKQECLSFNDSSQTDVIENKMNVKIELPKSEDVTKINLEEDVKKKLVLDRQVIKAVRRLSGVKTGVPTASVEPLVKMELASSNDNIRKRSHMVNEEKIHCMTTREDKRSKTPKRELRNRTIELVFDEEKENRKRKAESDSAKVPQKYVAMAEQVLHFERDTPPRFRRDRRQSSVALKVNLLKSRKSYNPRKTIAVTPNLMTSQRSRPVEILTQEQKEELELEEIKKNQVKAHPLNEKVLQPPKLPEKTAKVSTVVEPFNLTKVFKKPQENKVEPYKFTANPAPKEIFKKPVGLPDRAEIPITVPKSPAITKSTRYQARPIKVEAISVHNERGTDSSSSTGVPFTTPREKTTEVKPFSFYIRDQETLQRREKKIKEILEAEKKMREFKANPLPIFNPPKEINRSSKHSHLECSKSSVTSTSEASHEPFKARSPRVLRKPKFEVTLAHTHSEPEKIELHTERRIKERIEFEIRQQEKQEMIALAKDKMEQEKKRKEAEEIAQIRMEAVHKAQPMPKFKPLPNKINSQIPLTEPHSPCFTKRPRGNKLCNQNQNL